MNRMSRQSALPCSPSPFHHRRCGSGRKAATVTARGATGSESTGWCPLTIPERPAPTTFSWMERAAAVQAASSRLSQPEVPRIFRDRRKMPGIRLIGAGPSSGPGAAFNAASINRHRPRRDPGTAGAGGSQCSICPASPAITVSLPVQDLLRGMGWYPKPQFEARTVSLWPEPSD